MSEQTYPGKELVESAKTKLSKEELNALTARAYELTLERVDGWICEDIDRIGRMTRAENVIYCRLLWIIGQGNRLTPQVEEWEASRIQDLRKAHFSISELARVFQRSKSTIHAHLTGPFTSEEEREVLVDRYNEKLKEIK